MSATGSHTDAVARNERAQLPVVAILGDSRVFDTYYVNDAYPEDARYGYDKTFPHRLRYDALRSPQPSYDVVHIPDHFRGRSVESNVIRLALTDPAVVVLCDGIWETLVHKDWFIEWATGKIRMHPTLGSGKLDLSYSSRILADLFIANELPVSPRKYAARQRRILSYFRRRRRQCVWLSLTTPPHGHLERLHYAGNYRCIPEWNECLQAVNDAMEPLIGAYGADWLDLEDLALAHGGHGQALIDQWHFSKSFHARIAGELARRIPRLLIDAALPKEHISRAFLLARSPGDTPMALYGPSKRVEAWRAANPDARAVAVLADSSPSTRIAGLPVVPIENSPSLAARCIVLTEGQDISSETEAALLARLPTECTLLYPTELQAIDNPAGSDRAEQGRLSP